MHIRLSDWSVKTMWLLVVQQLVTVYCISQHKTSVAKIFLLQNKNVCLVIMKLCYFVYIISCIIQE